MGWDFVVVVVAVFLFLRVVFYVNWHVESSSRQGSGSRTG